MRQKEKQQLYTKQSPQRLKSLKEHALIESASSSNRIEGVEVDNKRVGTVVFGKSLLHDRSEEEIRGYRNALKLIHWRATQPRDPSCVLTFAQCGVKERTSTLSFW